MLDDEMIALRLMSERRADLVRIRTATFNHLHQLLMELIPAGAQQKLTASKAETLLATIRPRDIAGRTRRQLAVDLVEDVVALDRKLKDLDKRLREAVEATGTSPGLSNTTSSRSKLRYCDSRTDFPQASSAAATHSEAGRTATIGSGTFR